MAFFVLTALTTFAFPNQRLVLLFSGLLVFNFLLEASQAVLALGRQPSLMDIVAGAIASIVVLVAEYVRRSRCSALAEVEPRS